MGAGLLAGLIGIYLFSLRFISEFHNKQASLRERERERERDYLPPLALTLLSHYTDTPIYVPSTTTFHLFPPSSRFLLYNKQQHIGLVFVCVCVCVCVCYLFRNQS
jgi:hypothetical protein